MTQQLRIKRKYLEQIVSGTKKTEYRDFVRHYVSRFCIINDRDEAHPRKDIEAIRFYCPTDQGGQGLLLFAVVELKRIDFDSEGAVIQLHLGKVLETNVRLGSPR